VVNWKGKLLLRECAVIQPLRPLGIGIDELPACCLVAVANPIRLLAQDETPRLEGSFLLRKMVSSFFFLGNRSAK